MKKVLISGLLFISLVFIMRLAAYADEGEPPDKAGGDDQILFTIQEIFSDDLLAVHIASLLGKQSAKDQVASEELAEIEILEFSGYRREEKVCSLEGIRYLTGLKELYLDEHQIGDITELQYCTKLTVVNLMDNHIRDISPLGNLQMLQTLYIHKNNIEDFSPLESMSALQVLDLNTTGLRHLDVISGLSELRELYVWKNELDSEELAYLQPLNNLEILDINQNNIETLSYMPDLPELKAFYAWGNQITDVEPLARLVGLEILDINSNNIVQIDCLRDLEALRKLYIWNNEIEKIDVVRYFKDLEILNAHGNHIYDVSAVEDLRGLTFLDMKYQTIYAELVELMSDQLITAIPLIIPESIRYSVMKIGFEAGVNGSYDEETRKIRVEGLSESEGTLIYTFQKRLPESEEAFNYTGIVYQPYRKDSRVSMAFQKIAYDNTATALKNGAFRLYKLNKADGGWEAVSSLVYSDENGFFSFNDLIPGQYRLEEIQAPDGYQLAAGGWEFVIHNEDGRVDILEDVISGMHKGIEKTVYEEEDLYLIYNIRPVELPMAGGSKSQWIYSVMITLLAGGLGIRIKYK